MTPENIYRVYETHFNGHEPYHRLLGKFTLADNHIFILSDYDNALEKRIGHGPVTPEVKKNLAKLMRSQYYDVVSEHAIQAGYRPDLLQESSPQGQPIPEPEINTDDKSKARRPPVWDLWTMGQEQPDRLESKDGKLLMNGQPLSEDEKQSIFDDIKAGVARLRYPRAEKDPMKLAKSVFESLHKATTPLPGDEEYGFDEPTGFTDEAIEFAKKRNTSFKIVTAAAEAGGTDPEHLANCRQYVYGDTMIPNMGNKAAYVDHILDLQQSRKRGTHIFADMNWLKPLNEQLSYAHGDHAISMVGNAFKKATENSDAKNRIKSHRYGGDEFHFWIEEKDGESPEEHQKTVAQFLADARSHLESAVPENAKFSELNATHKVTFCAGVGKSIRKANEALHTAKAEKAKSGRAVSDSSFHFAM